MKPEERVEQWKQRMEEYQSSGQTQATWCEENSISLSTFRYWRHRIRKEDPPKQYDDSEIIFARLPGESERNQTEESVAPIILCTNGIRVELYPSCSREMMHHLMSALRANV